MPKAKAPTLHFTVDSKLLFELGEQLVARKWVALAELVKNAYDADATEVEITLLRAGKKSGSIVVKDDGVGMTFEVIKRSWMRLGTTTKTENPRSEKYERLRTGAKGVGRFACRRLASTLKLASTPDGGSEAIHIVFDWDKFAPGTELSQIHIKYKRLPRPQVKPGVTLTLKDLREPWTRDDVQMLQKELLQLVSPEISCYSDSASDPGFSLRINAPEYPELSGSLAQQFTETAWGTLSGTLSKSGTAKYDLTITNTAEVLSFKPEDVNFRRAGPCHFSSAYVIYRGEFFKNVPFTVAEARDYGREHGGVRIYMDGFRVFPYGEAGDDWLELDADRARRLTATPPELHGLDDDLQRPMLLLPGNMQLFGGVYLSREANRNISLSITRERLLENDAFDEVRKFVRLGINWMTVQYARLGVKPRETPKDRAGSPLAHLEDLRDEIAAATELETSAKQRMLQVLSLARADYEREQNDQISELAMLRILASVGTMVVIFDHELRGLVDSLHGIVTDTKAVARRLTTAERPHVLDIVSRLEGWTESVEQQGAYLGLLLSPSSRQRRRRYLLRDIVADAEKSFKRYRTDMSIQFINKVPASLRTPAIFRSELQSVLLNLLTNALKATRLRDVRRIMVTARKEDEEIIVEVCDTGVGIPDDIKPSVFEPFVTTSAPDPLLGVGTGLGLKIVKDIVESYGGKAWVSDTHHPWSTCISISLPAKP